MKTPSESATHLTFDTNHFGGVMDKLRWEIQQQSLYEGRFSFVPNDEPRAEIWMAMNAASTGWSLIEWAEHDLEKVDRCSALRTYAGVPLDCQMTHVKEAIRRAHPVVDLCYYIAHATKHASLRKIKPGVSTWARDWRDPMDKENLIKKNGIVERTRDGEFVSYNVIGNDLADLMIWAVDFARALNLPENQ